MTQIAVRGEPISESIIDRRLKIMKRFTGTIEKEKPEQVHRSLIQAYVELYEIMENLVDENQAIRKMIRTKSEDIADIRLQEIVIANHDYLQNYKGEYVALTFDGVVVEHSTSQIDLLKKIDNLPISKNQLFIYSVPLV